jgi:acyl carrier protein
MKLNKETILADLQSAIKDQLRFIEPEADDTLEGLQLDRLDMASVIMRIEQERNIEIDESLVQPSMTIGALAEAIAASIATPEEAVAEPAMEAAGQ